MELEDPLLSWKRPAKETYSEPGESTPHHHTILLQDTSYHDPPIILRLRSGSYFQLNPITILPLYYVSEVALTFS